MTILNQIGQANAYADLSERIPWLHAHQPALQMVHTISLSNLDILLLDIATCTAVTWAHDLGMDSCISRLDYLQTNFRRILVDAGLPYHPASPTV